MNFTLPDALSANLRQFTESRLAIVSPATRKNTLSKLLRFLTWVVSFQRENFTTWRDTTPTIVDNFCAERCKNLTKAGTRLRPRTVERDLIALKTWILWNEERELTGPIRSASIMRPLPRDTFAEIHTITPEQERAILDRSRWIHEGGRGLRFPEHRLGKLSYHNARQTGWRRGAFRLYVLLMLRNGLRPSEALRLRWDEINLYANPPFMRLKHLEHGDGGRVLKTEKSADAITLARAHKPDQWSGPADSIDVAKELRAFRKEALGPWVFGADDPWTQKPVFPDDHFIWRALKFELGDSRLKAYSLRHTLATRMSARGFTAEEVARVLRNTARVCERYYIAGTRERDAFDISTAQRVQVRQALA